MEMIVITRAEFENVFEDKMRNFLLSYSPQNKAQEPQNEELLLDKREAGKLLNCSVSTIDSMRRNGSLEPIYIGGRKGAVRFRKSDIMKFINK